MSTARVKADVSGHKRIDSISVSVDREMQTADNNSSEMPVHLEMYKFHLQQQDPQINTADMLSLYADRHVERPITQPSWLRDSCGKRNGSLQGETGWYHGSADPRK